MLQNKVERRRLTVLQVNAINASQTEKSADFPLQVNGSIGDVDLVLPATRAPLLETTNTNNAMAPEEEKLFVGSGIEKALVHQADILKAIYERLFEDDADKNLVTKWRQLAIVLDRIFFVITTILVVSISLMILLKKPPYDVEKGTSPAEVNTTVLL